MKSNIIQDNKTQSLKGTFLPLMPNIADCLLTMNLIELNTTLKELQLEKIDQSEINDVTAKLTQIISNEFHANYKLYAEDSDSFKLLNNNIDFFIKNLPETILETTLVLAESLVHCIMKGHNSLKVCDQFGAAINLLYLAKQVDRIIQENNEDDSKVNIHKEKLIDCLREIYCGNLTEVYAVIEEVNNDILGNKGHYTHQNIIGNLQDNIKNINSPQKPKLAKKVHNNFTTNTMITALNGLATLVSLIDTSEMKWLVDAELNVEFKELFFGSGLIFQSFKAIAEDLNDSSDNGGILNANATAKIQNNFTSSFKKIIASQIEELVTPMVTNFLLNSLNDHEHLSSVTRNLIRIYSELLPPKKIDIYLSLKLPYGLSVKLQQSLNHPIPKNIIDSKIEGFLITAPYLLEEKVTFLDQAKILFLPAMSFCISSIKILSLTVISELKIDNLHKEKIFDSTNKMLEVMEKELYINYNTLSLKKTSNKKFEQAVEVFFDKIPELALEFVDIIVSTIMHWSFKMPSTLKTFDKLFTIVNFIYLANRYEKLKIKDKNIEKIKQELLEAVESLQSNKLSDAQHLFDLASQDIEYSLHSGCKIYDFANYKTALTKELQQLDKVKSKLNTKSGKSIDSEAIAKIAKGLTILGAVISRVDFSSITFSKDPEFNDAIKNLLMEDGVCAELINALAKDLKISAATCSMLNSHPIELLTKTIMLNLEKIFLVEILEILLPIAEEIIMNMCDGSNVMSGAISQWLKTLSMETLEVLNEDKVIFNTLINLAQTVEEKTNDNILLDIIGNESTAYLN